MASPPGSDLSAAAAVEGNPHYLRAVTEMGERCRVVTQEAIHTAGGIKLVEKGARVDRSLYERLIQHKLSAAIETQLAVDDAVTVASLVELARGQCAQDALVSLLAQALGERGGGAQRLLAPVQALALARPLAFTLTVMRAQFPQLLAHSMRVALVAVYLGIRAGLDAGDCARLVAAGLLHDVGNLYMDPAWHDASRKITGEGRRHLMAHPITAALLLRSHAACPASVERAVLEHHERMDGSGYPRGLAGDGISPMGQILLVAEIVAAFFEKYGDQAAAQRLSLLLKLYRSAYPADLAAFLLPVLRAAAEPQSAEVRQEEVQQAAAYLSAAFDDWSEISASLPPQALAAGSGHACALVQQRLQVLQKNLFEAGSHPRQLALALPYLLGDEQGLAELAFLGREALWQLQAIIDAALSRWPGLAQSGEASDAAVVRWCEACAGRRLPESA